MQMTPAVAKTSATMLRAGRGGADFRPPEATDVRGGEDQREHAPRRPRRDEVQAARGSEAADARGEEDEREHAPRRPRRDRGQAARGGEDERAHAPRRPRR